MSAPARAFGRSLADFHLPGTFDLHPGEAKLREACRLGESAILGDAVPDSNDDPTRFVRAAFLRFLALGGDADAPVHERGVELQGAWLDGPLDLAAATVDRRLGLYKCRIARINALDAVLQTFGLSGSFLAGDFTGDRLVCKGNVLLNDRFRAAGTVRLAGATIGGILVCSDGRFEKADGGALICDVAKIGGTVLLDGGFHAKGTVRLLGATIGRDLVCIGGRFEKAAGRALLCENSEVTGVFWFRQVASFAGELNLTGMRAGGLCDDQASWQLTQGRIFLDGFTYGRLIESATDAATRIAWLDMQ